MNIIGKYAKPNAIIDDEVVSEGARKLTNNSVVKIINN